MNTQPFRFARHKIFQAALFIAWLAAVAISSPAAEPKPLRLAIGPFFAPVANESLRQASQSMPELLMAALSHESRFELVEREKVEGIWNEMKLTSSGLVAKETVTKLGHVLACDWLISGSFVQAGGKTHVWTKVIDVRSGVLIDLNDSPYDGSDHSKVVPAISTFLTRAGSQPKGRQFLTMGQFFDLNPPGVAKGEDWTRRLTALIESHFLKTGYGVVEMAAVGPIFEERRLENAGLAGHPEGRVKLQAAFWLVDGACGWLEGEPLRLGVSLRVQQVGGPEQMICVTNFPGEPVEQDVIRALSSALAKTNLVSQPNPNAEADLLAVRGMEMAERRRPFMPFQSRPSLPQVRTQLDDYKEGQERLKAANANRTALMANYERLLLRDPDNQQAKLMLAHGLLAESGKKPAKRERAMELLREVAANKNDLNAATAANRLLGNPTLLDMMARDGGSMPRPRPKDWKSLNQAYQENPSDLEIKCDLGAALLGLLRATDRERGRAMLLEVAAGDRPDQADRARKLLAEPERSPAMHDPPPKKAPADARPAPATQAQPVPDPEEDSVTQARREFLQKNFSKFIPAKFEKDGPQVALFQTLPVQANKFAYDGKHYCGFRFIVPSQMDGNLKWMHMLAKTEKQKEFSASNFGWYIVAKNGKMNGFENYATALVTHYEKLHQRFPYTNLFFVQELPQRYLKPGEEYAIWFSFEESDLPDIAFALTIQSQDGCMRYGALPMQ